jgi:hypothetical protein
MLSDAFGRHEDRTPTHSYEPTREAAMAAFAKRVGSGSEGMSAFGVTPEVGQSASLTRSVAKT